MHWHYHYAKCMDFLFMHLFFILSMTPNHPLWKKHQGWAGNQVQYLAQRWYTTAILRFTWTPFLLSFTTGTIHYSKSASLRLAYSFLEASGCALFQWFNSAFPLGGLHFCPYPLSDWTMWLVQKKNNSWNKQTNNNNSPQKEPTKKYIVVDKKVQCETGEEQNGASDEIISFLCVL